MKPGLAFVSESSFLQRDYNRFGIETLRKDFDVVLLDCASIAKGRDQVFTESDQPGLPGCHLLSKLEELTEFFENRPCCFYVDILGMGVSAVRIRRILKRAGVQRIRLALGLLPWVSEPLNFAHKLLDIVKSGNGASKIVGRITSRVIGHYEPRVDFLVCSGSESVNSVAGGSTELIWSHSFDFQHYLETRDSAITIDLPRRFALFIDQFAPSHPDYAFHGNIPPVSAEHYYPSMIKFFEMVENAFNLEVIISAHPRRDKSSEGVWGGRRVVWGKTPELIKESTVVLSHYSTALSFAVITRTPIVLVTTDEYFSSYRKNQFLAFGEALSIEILNADSVELSSFNESLLEVDEGVFSQYEERYIRSSFSVTGNLWESVAQALLQVITTRN